MARDNSLSRPIGRLGGCEGSGGRNTGCCCYHSSPLEALACRRCCSCRCLQCCCCLCCCCCCCYCCRCCCRRCCCYCCRCCCRRCCCCCWIRSHTSGARRDTKSRPLGGGEGVRAWGWGGPHWWGASGGTIATGSPPREMNADGGRRGAWILCETWLVWAMLRYEGGPAALLTANTKKQGAHA